MSQDAQGRGFQRWFSDLASAGRDLKRVARETRDAMVLLRHSAKHGEQSSVPAEGAVQVELLAAADLSYAPGIEEHAACDDIGMKWNEME